MRHTTLLVSRASVATTGKPTKVNCFSRFKDMTPNAVLQKLDNRKAGYQYACMRDISRSADQVDSNVIRSLGAVNVERCKTRVWRRRMTINPRRGHGLFTCEIGGRLKNVPQARTSTFLLQRLLVASLNFINTIREHTVCHIKGTEEREAIGPHYIHAHYRAGCHTTRRRSHAAVILDATSPDVYFFVGKVSLE